MFCLFNGEILPIEQAAISLTDLGILRGYGFFDYLRTYNGVPFLLEEHLQRLDNTSSILNLGVPFKRNQIITWINELLQRNAFTESHIKIVVTGGPSSDGVTVESPCFYILVTPLTPNSEILYTEGISLLMHEHLRLFPDAKSLNYLTALSLRKEKKHQQAYEILYTYQGNVLEASTSNVFLFKKDTLVTPKDNILPGITRNLVIQLAKKEYQVEVRSVSIEELLLAEEVFITASNKEVMPVVKINDNVIGQGIPGKNSKRLLEIYRNYITEYSKNFSSID